MTGSRGRALTVAAALLVAGCASTGANHASNASLAAVAPATAVDIETPAEVAQHLLDEARVPPGAVQTKQPLIKILRQPPDRPGASGLIVLYRWWRINEPLATAYAWVLHHQSPALPSAGSSSSSGPMLGDQENAADFAPLTFPATVNTAQLSIAVAPVTAQISAIGAYAVIIRQPPRPQIENVPPTVDTVTVITRRTTGQPDGGSVLGRTTLTGAAAQRLVRDFDALKVQPPGEQFSCPMSFVTQTASFRAGTHVWSATVGVCIGVDVNLNGHQLPTLDSSNSFTHDLHAAFGHRFPKPLGMQPMTLPGAETSAVNR